MLFDEKLVLISKDEINRKRLNEYRWIVYGSEDNIFKISRKQSQSIINVSDIHVIVELVRLGVGIAVVPDHLLRKNENIQVYNLPSQTPSQVFMTTLNFKSMPWHIKEIAEGLFNNLFLRTRLKTNMPFATFTEGYNRTSF